jgi:hypothetical protein
MGCGCKSCGGRIPRQQRYLVGEYEVQPGDHVGQICNVFGIAIDRWHELVGANLDKPLGEEPPYGYRHKCFKTLEPGEKLRIPGGWNPGAVSGRVGAPLTIQSPQTTSDQLQQMINALTQKGVDTAIMKSLDVSGMTLPANVNMNDVMAVMFSWWPYAKFPGVQTGTVPPLPTVVNPTPVGIPTLVMLGMQAIAFLRATGITNGTSPQVQNIPWDVIQWKSIPWDTLGAQALQSLSQAMLSTALPAHTTMSLASASQMPDFFNTNFGQQSWTDILSGVTWSDSLTEVLSDPEVVECIKRNPSRLQKLTGCKQCYETTEQFKTILCATEPADPCDCDEPAPLPVEPVPGQETQTAAPKEDNTALIVAASVIGVLGVAATAFALSRKG